MPYFSEDHPSDTQIATDRRRRGRTQTDNPHLIALFRNPIAVEATSAADIADQIASRAPAETDEHDPRALARGVVVGVSVGTLLWAMVALVAWHLF